MTLSSESVELHEPFAHCLNSLQTDSSFFMQSTMSKTSSRIFCGGNATFTLLSSTSMKSAASPRSRHLKTRISIFWLVQQLFDIFRRILA